MMQNSALLLCVAVWVASGLVTLTSDGRAQEPRIAVLLPNCPTPLLLSAPSAFEGAKNEQNILDQLAANSVRKGTYVLSLSAPAKPDLRLLVLELGTTKGIQGSVSQAQFDELRAYATSHDLAAMAESKKYAEALAKGAQVPMSVKGTNIYSVSDDTQVVTLLALGSSVAAGQDVTNYIAMKLVYAHNCIAQLSMFSPISSMSIQQFEALVPQLLIQ